MIIIEYILGSLFRLSFIFSLFLFHAIQVVAYNIIGYKAQQRAIYYLNACILLCFKVAGTNVKYNDTFHVPTNQPLIIIANHQSMWDIVGIYWFLRKHRPLFVAKKELLKGIPSISYNLRKSGSALIDRKDRNQALKEISIVAQRAYNEKRAIVIFPEGSRSRSDTMKKFYSGGISSIIKQMPDVTILPICIQGTGKLAAKKPNRIRPFKKISWTVLEPFNSGGLSPEDIANKSHFKIKEELVKA